MILFYLRDLFEKMVLNVKDVFGWMVGDDKLRSLGRFLFFSMLFYIL